MDKQKPIYSIHKQRCIGKCVPPNTPYIHPILLTPYVSIDKITCPTNPYVDEESKQIVFADECDAGNNNTIQNVNYMVPLNIDDKNFLELIYNIHSFEESIIFVQEFKNLPYATLDRILNSSWIVFIDEIPLIRNIFTNFYIFFINKFWKSFLIQSFTATEISEIKKKLANNEFMEEIIMKAYERINDRYKYNKTINYNDKLRKYIKIFIKEKIIE